MSQLRAMMMPDVMGSFNQGRQIGEEQRAKSTLAKFAQGAIGGDQSALSKIYQGAGADTGLKVQQMAQGQQKASRDQQLDDLQRVAAFYASAPPQLRPHLYTKVRGLAEGLEIIPPGAAPESLDTPEAQQNFEKFIASLAGGSQDSTPAAIRELQMLQSDPELAALDMQRRQAGWRPSVLETADGMSVFDPRTKQAAPLTYGGGAPQAGGVPPMQGGFGIAETDNYVKKILGNAGQIDPNAPPEQIVQQLLPHVIQQESGGDPNAVSPKGARGLMQVMPATGQDPGFGVAPLRDSSPQENVRFGTDYLSAMVKRYPGRPDLALAAYNAGPGVADRFASPVAQAGGGRVMPAAKQSSPIEMERLRLAQDANRRAEEAANRAAREEQRRISNPGAGKAPTEGERKAATLLKRMDGSLSQLEAAVKADPDAASPSIVGSIAGSLPLVGDVARNAVSSSGRQQVEAAQLDILDAALTLGTGAAYTREQLEGYRKAYFPQLGDTPATISAKKARLQNVVQAARIAAGRAAPSNAAQSPSPRAQGRPSQPAKAPPADDDEALIGRYL